MPTEMIVTSAPRGLFPGTYGFCAVACSRGMSETTMRSLESISGYRRVEGSVKPVVYSHYEYEISGVKTRILSRIADAGVDYSRRTNKLAHHLVLTDAETKALPSGPAALCAARGVFTETWRDSDPPRYLNERALNNPSAIDARSIPDGEWRRVAGDSGWAGALASTVKSRRPVALIVRPNQDVLILFREALALLPPDERWKATFSTFFTTAPPAARCQWKTLIVGACDVNVLVDSRALVLDLSGGRLGSVERFGDASLLVGDAKTLVDAARAGRAPAPTAPPTFNGRQTPSSFRPQSKDLGVFHANSRAKIDVYELAARDRNDASAAAEKARVAATANAPIEQTVRVESPFVETDDEDDAPKSAPVVLWALVSLLFGIVLSVGVAAGVMIAWKSPGNRATPEKRETKESQDRASSAEANVRTTSVEPIDENSDDAEKPEASGETDENATDEAEETDESATDEAGETDESATDKEGETDESATDKAGEKGSGADETNALETNEKASKETEEKESDVDESGAEKTDKNLPDAAVEEKKDGDGFGSENSSDEAKDITAEEKTDAFIVFERLKTKKELDAILKEINDIKESYTNKKDSKKSDEVSKLLSRIYYYGTGDGEKSRISNQLNKLWKELDGDKAKYDKALKEIENDYENVESSKFREKYSTFFDHYPALFETNDEKNSFIVKFDELKMKIPDVESEINSIAEITDQLEEDARQFFIERVKKNLKVEKNSKQITLNDRSVTAGFAEICYQRQNTENPLVNEITLQFSDESKIKFKTEKGDSKKATVEMRKDDEKPEKVKYQEYAEFAVLFDEDPKTEYKLRVCLILNKVKENEDGEIIKDGSVRIEISPPNENLRIERDYERIFEAVELRWIIDESNKDTKPDDNQPKITSEFVRLYRGNSQKPENKDDGNSPTGKQNKTPPEGIQ